MLAFLLMTPLWHFLLQLDRLEETRKLVQGLVRKYPNYAEAHAVLAAVLWREGNRDQAEGQFSEATSREPRYQDIRSEVHSF
jgi:Tfp pilus assembly protein PilF